MSEEAWRLARCGSIGASEVPDVLRRGKNGAPSASRASLLARKVAERLTGVPVNTYRSQAMQDGLDREAEARAAYELATCRVVDLCPMPITHPDIPGAHASPDGVVIDD